MADRVFEGEQFLPLPREEVFAFFSTPRNLEAITPPWLNFRIAEESAPHPGEGVEYRYRLRVRGLPMTWRSRIQEWRENERFVDVQLQGPYAKWHHTHEFVDQDGGTLIRDRVLYRLPFGWLGNLFGGWYVDADVRKIFAYREKKISELLESDRVLSAVS